MSEGAHPPCHDQNSGQYRGRFAPSPTGELHLGSLVSALASYLDSRARSGLWLIRIEDIDPPREIAGASQTIIDSLSAHGLHSDEDIVYQSERLNIYHQSLEKLHHASYHCYCTRARIKTLGGRYDGHCRNHKVHDTSTYALRVRADSLTDEQLVLAEAFTDTIKGKQYQPLSTSGGDFIIQRKDQLIAYQLAVVVDDIAQNITHVIRGDDLLSSTARQRYLFLLLGKSPPEYGHIPVVTNPLGQKLSKQNHALPLENHLAFDNLLKALSHLNMRPPHDLRVAKEIDSLLAWGADHWHY